MQIVNGYICMNCCDVDKARLGQDPHQSADQLKKQTEGRLDNVASGRFGPAVTFGGTLQANQADSTGGSNGSGNGGAASASAGPPSSNEQNGWAPSSSVDLLV